MFQVGTQSGQTIYGVRLRNVTTESPLLFHSQHKRGPILDVRRPFKTAVPYAGDAMSLPVHNLEDALPFYENIMGFCIVSREGAGSSRIFAHTGFSPLSSAPSVIEAFAIRQTKGVFPSGSQYALLELGYSIKGSVSKAADRRL